MGKLDKARMQNATKLNKVDDEHNELEEDLGEIFGIPDDTEIDPAIFEGVDNEGRISGVVRLYQAAASSTAADCIGFEFNDGTKKKRMIFVESTLRIYEWDDPDWDLVADMEVPGSGKLVDLSDVDDTALADGFLLAAKADDTFEFVAPASGAGVTEFSDLSDGFDISTHGTKFVAVNAGGTSLEAVDAPTGLGDPEMYWLAAPSPVDTNVSTWGQPNWIDMYGWADVSVADGGLLTAATLVNDALDANKFVTLAAGIYEISFWFNQTTHNQYGTREWRVVGDDSTGPAIWGSNFPALTFRSTSSTFSAGNGIQFLGTRTLIQAAGGDIKLQVRQNSGSPLFGCAFSITIHRVK